MIKYALILGAVIALLFWKSIVPGWVQFSNDGPFGTVVSEQANPLTSWSSGWQDLNWIGGEYPTPGPAVSMGFRMLCFMSKGPLIILSLPAIVFYSRLKQFRTAKRWLLSLYVTWCVEFAVIALVSFLLTVSARRYVDPSPLLCLGGLLFGFGVFLIPEAALE